MKRFIIISYDGSNLNPSEVVAIASQLKTINPNVENIHASTMDETEVNSVIVKHAESKNATELSVVESACIYVKRNLASISTPR